MVTVRRVSEPSSAVLPVDEYVARLAKKRMAAGVLYRDTSNRVLLLTTSYKPNLEVPGGAVEADEAPWDTATREVAEELGLDRPLGRLLVVGYVLPQDSRPEGIVPVRRRRARRDQCDRHGVRRRRDRLR